MKIKNDSSYEEAKKLAEVSFRTPGFDFKKIRPYISSSNMDDAYCISYWCMYHTGKVPEILHKSSGYTWIVDIPNYGLTKVKIIDNMDHREGIVELPNDLLHRK
jgi:hypothetical protein